ncbi:LINE-1 retrotransposable element ORF1 protein [Plecturocebus cupreus]
MKITEEELAAILTVLQLPQQRDLNVRRKTKKEKRNNIISKKDVHSETPSESHQLQRPQVDKSTKMGRNQNKKNENIQNQNASPKTGFRRWVITNFSELKEHVLTQCKETKNLEKRFQEMLTRINSLEKNINDLMELKHTTRELCEAYTNFDS